MNPLPPESPTHDLTDRTLGDYRIIRRLGRGGMADVYLAEQLSLKRKVAFKVLKAELAKDASYVERFHREAQAAAALVQANIVQIYEVGDFDGIHFIAQEYVPGRNLRQYLSRYGAVEPLMALNVIRQVSLALQKADEIGVVHRDIKPENIMLSTNGEIKVTDFGLARLTNAENEIQRGLTQIGITMGTPLYMSPEQAEGKHLDTRSDIYSLGATVYHILAGQPPFDGENAIAIAVKQVNDAAEPLSDIRPDAPEMLNTLIHRMMSKDPDNRPTNASGLLKELRKVRISDDEDWETLAGRLATRSEGETHGTTLTETKLAVTRQLQSVMRGHIESWWSSRRTLMILATLVFGGVAVGLVAAFNSPPKNLLENVESRAISDSVRKFQTVAQQYQSVYWSVGDVEKYWKAVEEYFPVDEAAAEDRNETEYYNQLARERLAEIYVERYEFDEALAIYDQFADSTGLSKRVNIAGWAGQAVVFDLQDETDLAEDALYKVELEYDQLSMFLRQRIIDLLIKYRQSDLSDF